MNNFNKVGVKAKKMEVAMVESWNKAGDGIAENWNKAGDGIA